MHILFTNCIQWRPVINNHPGYNNQNALVPKFYNTNDIGYSNQSAGYNNQFLPKWSSEIEVYH